jgi:hypothetical protein
MGTQTIRLFTALNLATLNDALASLGWGLAQGVTKASRAYFLGTGLASSKLAG